MSAAASGKDLLCLADQGSFLGLRALGRGPVLQFTWLLARQPDDAEVLALNARLGQGLFARLVQRSPLPWGRHRWVASAVLPPVTWFPAPPPGEQPTQLHARLLDLAVDPEHGPGWRLVVQPLAGGGCALSVLVSHTLADGQASVQTIADALAGRRHDVGHAAPSGRWSPRRLLDDGAESLRGLPEVARAIKALVQRRRAASAPVDGTSPSRLQSHAGNSRSVIVPVVQVAIVADAFDRRAADLGVAANTLFAALAVGLASSMGRVDATGRVKLVMPVSDRQPGDTRGNALRAATVLVEPGDTLTNPKRLQRDIRAALATLLRHGDEISPLLPLLPYVPLRLARNAERLALGSDRPVGCSILGALPGELERPCGAASLLQISLLERYSQGDLARLGGLLFLVCYRLGGQVLVTVTGHSPGHITDRAGLAPAVEAALAALGLSATLS